MTDVSPVVTAPTLWNYAVCGQYPGAVGETEIVTLQCTCNTGINYLYNTCTINVLYLQCSCNMTASYRYLIVQFPLIESANFCEVEVYIRRKLFYMHTHFQTDSTSELENNIIEYVRSMYMQHQFSFPFLFLPFHVVLKVMSLSVLISNLYQ